MPRPIELVRTLHEAFQKPLGTVREQARLLRDAELMTKDKRGPGKGTLTIRDATHLLVAAAGTERVMDSAWLVRQHAAFPLHSDSSNKPVLEALGLGVFQTLPAKHTFADGIDALIELPASNPDWQLRDGELRHAVHNLIELNPNQSQCLHITVMIEDPHGGGKIRFQILSDVRGSNPDAVPLGQLEYQRDLSNGQMIPSFEIPSHGGIADLSHEHRFTHATTDALGALFRD